jgi:hypothetical protein
MGTSFVSPHDESPFTLFAQTLKVNVPQLPPTGVYVNGNDTTPPEFALGAACITSVLLFDVPLHGKASTGPHACSPPSPPGPSVPVLSSVVPSLCAIRNPPYGLLPSPMA